LYLLFSTKKPKSLPPDTISELKMYPKCFCGVGSSSWIWGSAPRQGSEGDGKEEKGTEGKVSEGRGEEEKGGERKV